MKFNMAVLAFSLLLSLFALGGSGFAASVYRLPINETIWLSIFAFIVEFIICAVLLSVAADEKEVENV